MGAASEFYGIWKFAKNKETAIEFLKYYADNWAEAFKASEGYNNPCFANLVPKPMPILSNDPTSTRPTSWRSCRLPTSGPPSPAIRAGRAGDRRDLQRLHHPRHDGEGRDRINERRGVGQMGHAAMRSSSSRSGPARPDRVDPGPRAFARGPDMPSLSDLGSRMSAMTLPPGERRRGCVTLSIWEVQWLQYRQGTSSRNSARSPPSTASALTVPDGEFMVLLGPSGCGKTTFLRIICGLEQQTSGDLLIGGDIVNDIPPRARGVAMMFQSYGLYPHFSVRNNIAFPLRTQRVPQRRDRQEGRVGLATARHRPSARPPAASTLGRRAPAGCARARAGARADRAAARRAAVEPRRQTALLCAPGDQAVPAAGRRHHHLRDARSGRGHGHGRPHRRHRPRSGAPGGNADGNLRRSRRRFVATFVGAPPMNIVARNGGYLGFRPENFLPKDMIEGRRLHRIHVPRRPFRVSRLRADRLRRDSRVSSRSR